MGQKYKLVGSFMLVIIGLLFILMFHINIKEHSKTEDYSVIDEGWNMWIDGEEYHQISLSQTKFSPVQQGTEIVLEKVLEEKNIKYPVLEFSSIYFTFVVKLDGKEIYTYGAESYQKGEILGHGPHFIDLPPDYSGKTLQIIIKTSKDEKFTNIDTPRICNAKNLTWDYLYKNRIPLIIDMFLIVFGVCLLSVSSILMLKSRQMLKLTCIALMSVSIGVWSLCNYNLHMFFTNELGIKSICEYVSLYITSLFAMGYFHEEGTKCGGKYRKSCYYFLFGALIIFNIMALLLHITHICNFPRLLKCYHVLVFCMLIFIIVILIHDIWNNKADNYIILVAMLIVSGFTLYDVIKYNFDKYYNGKSINVFSGITSIALLILVIALILDFCFYILQSIKATVESETLKKLAYTDELTGLSNRRKYEESLDELDKKEYDYAIIGFDLNGLKQVNDSMGHEAGDKYIFKFGNILKKTFSEYGLVARIGGDEFVVIVKDVSKTDINTLIEKMQKLIDKENMVHKKQNMSTAYGISLFREDKAENARMAYRLADERMYQKKEEMKK